MEGKSNDPTMYYSTRAMQPTSETRYKGGFCRASTTIYCYMLQSVHYLHQSRTKHTIRILSFLGLENYAFYFLSLTSFVHGKLPTVNHLKKSASYLGSTLFKITDEVLLLAISCSS